MNQEKEQIFSSTGSLGVTRRQDNRVYINPEVYSQDPQDIRTLERLSQIVDRDTNRITRGVFRGVVSNDVYHEISRNGLSNRLEVAFPIAEFAEGEAEAMLIYWGHNHRDRQQIVPTDEMISATSEYRTSPNSPVDRMREVKVRGYQFVQTIDSADIDQIQSLWGPTFGWEIQEVEALQTRIQKDSQKDPRDRSVWFSAIRDNGTIISLATAERLTIPSSQGEVTLVESTEWRTRDEYSGQGLMTATLSMLNAQVLHDLGTEENLPIIYAECNFQSRSDRAGHGAGFVVPTREHAPQIIKQNVRVGDGYTVPQTDLRDFTYMHLSADNIRRNYDRLSRDIMLHEGY